MGLDLRSVVLPCMAPVLQRMGIDVKQTIRFGIGSDVTLKNLYLCGPGAAIPGMSKALGEHVELAINLVSGAENFKPREVGGSGSHELDFISSATSINGLLPSIAHEERTQSKLSHALVAGGVLAALVMAGEFAHSALQTQHWKEQMRMQQTQLQRVNAFEEDCRSASEFAGMIAQVAGLVTRNIDSVPGWDISLLDISEHIDAGIQIREIRGEAIEGMPVLQLEGIAIDQGEVPAAQVLDRFVANMGAVESIRSVALGATSRISMNPSQSKKTEPDQWGVEFQMRLYIESEPSRYQSYANIQIEQDEWSSP